VFTLNPPGSRHTGRRMHVHSVALSPDGKFASGTGGWRVKIWDTTTHELVSTSFDRCCEEGHLQGVVFGAPGALDSLVSSNRARVGLEQLEGVDFFVPAPRSRFRTCNFNMFRDRSKVGRVLLHDERIFIELMMSDRKLMASRVGSK